MLVPTIDPFNPLSLSSLWVPLTLLGLIGLAAIYFVRVNLK